jgi:RNA polymerase sigma-70 factor (ECF subfamily)
MSSVLPVVQIARSAAQPIALSDGDGQRFAKLVKDHERALFGFALRLSRDRIEATDLVQDTLERALRGFAGFTPDTNARAWMCTILYNLFIDRSRRRKLEVPRPLHELNQAAEEVSAPRWSAITSEQLRAALTELDEEFRAVCELRTFGRLSYAEIALKLGLPRNTVATRLMRGREKLKALLERQLEEQA